MLYRASTSDLKGRFRHPECPRNYRETQGANARTTLLDGVGNVRQATDRNGRVTAYQYDHLYQLTREVWKNSSGQETREFVYSYDTVGNLLSVQDNTINPSTLVRTTASDALQFVYDNRDQLQLQRSVNPLVGVSTVLDRDYDLNGLPTALASNLGGALVGSSISGGIKDFVNQYAHDALGRLTSLTQTGQSGGNSVAPKLATFQYDAASQLTDLRRYSSTSAYATYLEVHSRFGYDGAGRLQSITHAKAEIAAGQLWNGTSSLPSSLQGGNLLAGYFLAYDQDNRLTGWSSYADAFKTTYAYDNRDQVTGATHTAIGGLTLPRALPAVESYAFDGTGNRNLSGGSSSSANGTFNRVQNDGTYTYDYDAEGNQIRRTKISNGAVTEYEFDYRNRLVKVTERASAGGAATKIVTFQYDSFDRRTGKQLDADANGTIDRKTAWVWDGQQVVLQLVDADGAGSAPWKLTNRYLYGEAVDMILADEQLPNGGIGLTSVSYTSGSTLWPLADHLGSVRDLVDNNGKIREHVVYNSFGKRLSESDFDASGNPIASNNPAAVDHLFGYTGREWDDDIELQYNRARWYDPAQGRWLSQDPIGFAAGDVNLYQYVGNGPTYAEDPSGLVIVAIDGTGSGPFAETPDVINQDTGRYRSHVRNFWREYARVYNEGSFYFDGPDEDVGLSTRSIFRKALNTTLCELERTPNQEINIIGHSRGGYIAVELAAALKEEGYRVNFLGLYDPVDMDISVNLVDFDIEIPSNVDHAAIAIRDRRGGSRAVFNTVNPAAEDASKMKLFVHQKFFGTHAALGGAPWLGDTTGLHKDLTRPVDEQCSANVDRWMRQHAATAGIGFVAQKRVTQPDMPKPSFFSRIRSEMLEAFDWRNWYGALR
ncbi:MAG: RHS repeat domain-containing protein [Pirellulaceae bacterium]